MLIKLLTPGLRGLSWMASRKISRRTLLRYGGTTAGLVIAEQAIDLVAEYNDWVKENQTLLLIALALGSAPKGALGSLRSTILTRSARPILFTKVSYGKFRANVVPFLKAGSVKRLKDGVHVRLANGDFIKIVRNLKDRTLTVDHSGSFVTAAVLASGLAGAAFAANLDWEQSGAAILSASAEILAQAEFAELADELRKFSASDLVTGQAAIMRSLNRKYRLVGEEEIASTMMRVYSEEETRIGTSYIVSHEDADGDVVYTINGVTLSTDPSTNQLVSAVPTGNVKEVPLPNTALGYGIESMVRHSEEYGGLILTRVGNTSRFVSKPFGTKESALMVHWDEEKKYLSIPVATSSWFSAAGESLLSDSEASWLEELGNAYKGFSFSELLFEEDAPVVESSQQFEITLEDLLLELGKSEAQVQRLGDR